MSYYDASVGACPPGVGCPLPGYGYPYAAPVAPAYATPYAAPYVAPTYPLVQTPFSWDIIGQGPAPAPSPTVTERVSTFLNNETFGVKNRNLLLGAAALGGIYYGYTAGWFGGRGGRRARR